MTGSNSALQPTSPTLRVRLAAELYVGQEETTLDRGMNQR
jgi:hypothetical protein